MNTLMAYATNLNLWSFSSWVIALALTVVIICEHRRAPPSFSFLDKLPTRLETLTALFFIVVGLILRFAFLGEFFDGSLTSDESLISIIYTSAVAHNELARNGATHLAYALALDFWYQLFSFTPLAARALSATLGTLSLLCFFLGLRRVAGIRLALWSTAFLSISLYGIYFSKLALETGWVIFTPPIVFYLFILACQKRSALWAASAGLIFSIGLFSYPGALLATISIFSGMAISYLAYRRNAEPLPWREAPWWVLTLAFVGGSIPFITFTLYQHSTVLGVDGQGLLVGGGGLTFSPNAILTGWLILLHDALVHADSWYLRYRGLPFFETASLPLALYGLFMFWRAGTRADKAKRWLWYGLFLTIPICIAMVPFTGAYPGMRRALFVLLPYSVALGGGVIFLLSAITAQRSVQKTSASRKRFTPYKVLSLSVFLLATAHPLAYQFTTGLDETRRNFSDSFGKPQLPYRIIIPILKTHDIVLDSKVEGYFDNLIYTHYPMLYSRYHPEAGIHHRVLPEPYQETTVYADTMLLTWDAKFFGQLAASGKVSTAPESMAFDSANLPYWGVLASQQEGCCITSEPMKSLGSEMVMTFDKLNRLKHQFQCTGGNCGPDRSNFIYTLGGDVTFFLKPPSGNAPVLQLEVINPDAGRESLIFVNDVFVGALTVTALDASRKFADYTIPPQARLESGNWAIRISPPADPNMLGWDIVKAKLYRK